MEKVHDYVIACSSLEGIISDMQVIEDVETRPHKAITIVVERGRERQEWNEQKLPKALPGHSGGRLPGRCTEEKGREKEEGVKNRHGQEKNEKIEEGMVSQGQNSKQRWDSSQIDQMTEQLEEEQDLDDLIERRRMEGSSLKLDVVQKNPELVVNERMSQGERVNDPKEKKKVPGWSIEEMKERPNIAVEEDTEEMKNGEG